MNNFKELVVWQKEVDLAVKIYRVTADFPTSERFALASQMQRSAVLISSNIAEGWERGTTPEYIRFLYISKGSLYELETQIIILEKLKYINNETFNKLSNENTRIAMMLNKLVSKLKEKKK
jgi:four helix bundle protein